VLVNVILTEQLRGLASRRAKAVDYKSVRNLLVDEEVANGWSVHKRNKSTTRLERPKSHDKQFEDRVWELFSLLIQMNRKVRTTK
jgi:DNA sulfur modification protein DndB